MEKNRVGDRETERGFCERENMDRITQEEERMDKMERGVKRERSQYWIGWGERDIWEEIVDRMERGQNGDRKRDILDRMSR